MNSEPKSQTSDEETPISVNQCTFSTPDPHSPEGVNYEPCGPCYSADYLAQAVKLAKVPVASAGSSRVIVSPSKPANSSRKQRRIPNAATTTQDASSSSSSTPNTSSPPESTRRQLPDDASLDDDETLTPSPNNMPDGRLSAAGNDDDECDEDEDDFLEDEDDDDEIEEEDELEEDDEDIEHFDDQEEPESVEQPSLAARKGVRTILSSSPSNNPVLSGVDEISLPLCPSQIIPLDVIPRMEGFTANEVIKPIPLIPPAVSTQYKHLPPAVVAGYAPPELVMAAASQAPVGHKMSVSSASAAVQKEKGTWSKLFSLPLQRSRSAGCTVPPDPVPAHALFLNQKGPKTRPVNRKMDASGGVYGAADGVYEGGSAPTPTELLRAENRKKKRSLGLDVREKFSFFRRQTDLALNPKIPQIKESEKLLRSGRPTADQVDKWSQSFEALLNDRFGLSLFREFLRTEFSDENIEFWIACEEFKTIRGARKLYSRAQKIYNDYVAVQAKREVNLDSKTRMETQQEINSPSRHTFDQSQKRIQALMEKDSYQRFLRSEIFNNVLKESRGTLNSVSASTSALLSIPSSQQIVSKSTPSSPKFAEESSLCDSSCDPQLTQSMSTSRMDDKTSTNNNNNNNNNSMTLTVVSTGGSTV